MARLEAAAAAAAFMEALRGAPSAIAQNRLLNTKDRDLAAVLCFLPDEERRAVFALVGSNKARRLQAEVLRMRNVHLDQATISSISAHLIAHLTGDHPLGPASKYFRPYRPRP